MTNICRISRIACIGLVVLGMSLTPQSATADLIFRVYHVTGTQDIHITVEESEGLSLQYVQFLVVGGQAYAAPLDVAGNGSSGHSPGFLGFTADQMEIAGLLARDAPGGIPYPSPLPDFITDVDPGVTLFPLPDPAMYPPPPTTALFVYPQGGFQSEMVPAGQGETYLGRVLLEPQVSAENDVYLLDGSAITISFELIVLLPPADDDGDGIPNRDDTCPFVSDPEQLDRDGNGLGDLCNDAEDMDGDDYADGLDNCPDDANPDQEDLDGNGTGDVCNDFEDRDGDDIADDLDVCPDDFDPTGADRDGDGVHDVCDPFPDEFDNEKAQLRVDLDAADNEIAELQEALAECLLPPAPDSDGDGLTDDQDACPDSPPGKLVDAAGCAQAEFCASIAVGWSNLFGCLRADWQDDEPAHSFPRDCRLTGSWSSLSCRATY